MCSCNDMTSIGFSNESVPVGTHMCLVFTNEEDRVDSLLKYLLSGVTGEERMACFSDRVSEEEVAAFLASNGISYDQLKVNGMLTLLRSSTVYFEGGCFDPDRMLDLLKAFYTDALSMGFKASRVIGEMVPEVLDVPGGDRLLEYESRVSLLARTHPVTAVCQYDANLFDGATIMEVLKVHPKMIVNGAVVNNPFFIEPEDYLQGLAVA